MTRFLLCIAFFYVSTSIQAETKLKIISYNIWNGFEHRFNIKKHQDFIQWAKKQDTDVLALQELCGYTQKTLEQDAKKWGHNYALILKENGYPVGITSKFPIELKERIRKQMGHGALHAKINGIDFFCSPLFTIRL